MNKLPLVMTGQGDYTRSEFPEGNTDGFCVGHVVVVESQVRTVGEVASLLSLGSARVAPFANLNQGKRTKLDVRLSVCRKVRSGDIIYRAMVQEGVVLECRIVRFDRYFVTLQVPGEEQRTQVPWEMFLQRCFYTRDKARTTLRSWRTGRSWAARKAVGA